MFVSMELIYGGKENLRSERNIFIRSSSLPHPPHFRRCEEYFSIKTSQALFRKTEKKIATFYARRAETAAVQWFNPRDKHLFLS